MTEKEAYYVQKTLQELRFWLVTTNERERKNRQKLLRNLKVSIAYCIASVMSPARNEITNLKLNLGDRATGRNSADREQ